MLFARPLPGLPLRRHLFILGIVELILIIQIYFILCCLCFLSVFKVPRAIRRLPTPLLPLSGRRVVKQSKRECRAHLDCATNLVLWTSGATDGYRVDI